MQPLGAGDARDLQAALKRRADLDRLVLGVADELQAALLAAEVQRLDEPVVDLAHQQLRFGAHLFRDRLEFGAEDARGAHAAFRVQIIEVQIEVPVQPLPGQLDLADFDEPFREARAIALDQRDAEVLLRREVVMDRRVADAELDRDVVIGEAVVAPALPQRLGAAQDLFASVAPSPTRRVGARDGLQHGGQHSPAKKQMPDFFYPGATVSCTVGAPLLPSITTAWAAMPSARPM